MGQKWSEYLHIWWVGSAGLWFIEKIVKLARISNFVIILAVFCVFISFGKEDLRGHMPELRISVIIQA